MAKALPIIGIAGAVAAVLAAAVLVESAMLLVPLVGIVGSVVLLGQRSVAGTVAGLAALLLAVVAILGLLGSVSTEDGSVDLGIPQRVGVLLAFADVLLLPVAAVVLRWPQAQPRWLAYAAFGCATIALVLAGTDASGLADHGTLRTLVLVVLCLATMAPCIALLRVPPQEEVLVASRETAVPTRPPGVTTAAGGAAKAATGTQAARRDGPRPSPKPPARR